MNLKATTTTTTTTTTSTTTTLTTDRELGSVGHEQALYDLAKISQVECVVTF